MSASEEVPRVVILNRQYDSALAVSALVKRCGYAVAGPFCTSAEARMSLQGGLPAAAILDVELGDGPTDALAIALRRAGVAIIYQCAWDEISTVPLEVPDAAFLEHDADAAMVDAVLHDVLGSAEAAPT